MGLGQTTVGPEEDMEEGRVLGHDGPSVLRVGDLDHIRPCVSLAWGVVVGWAERASAPRGPLDGVAGA